MKRELAAAKVESQFARAMRYVEAVGARVVVPSAGPPCFLDPELFGLNVITGDELSIFPDADGFLDRLAKAGIDTGTLVVPGTDRRRRPGRRSRRRTPHPTTRSRAIFTDKDRYLRAYQADWLPWLAEAKATWPAPRPGPRRAAGGVVGAAPRRRPHPARRRSARRARSAPATTRC